MDRFTELNSEACPKDGDGAPLRILQDSQLKLDWGPTLPKRMTHRQATEACEKLGMRLPTIEELESLRDRTRYRPATVEAFAGETKSDPYWSSTPDAELPDGYAWGVGFSCGDSGFNGRSYQFWVRPVRASQ